MASTKKTQTTNKILFDTIQELRKFSNKAESEVFKAVAQKLSAPASQRSEVNVGHLEKHAKEGETVVVPGKLLGDGKITKKVTVAAFRASESAKVKIEKAGGKYMTLQEYLSKNPKEKPRIIG
jgi:large subunit ribosomal protein L18e